MRVLLIDEWPDLAPVCGSGLGSSLLKLPAAADVGAAGHEVALLTSASKAELLRGAPALAERFAAPGEVPWERFERVVPLGLSAPDALRAHPGLRADPRPPARLKRDYDRVSHVQFWRALVAAGLGLAPPAGPARMEYRVPDAGRGWARATLPRAGPVVALSLSALTPLKRYLGWAEVAARLRAARPELGLVLVGQEPPAEPFPPGTLDLTRQTSFAQLGGVLAHSAVVAGTDGLVTNLAVASGRPTVALFTVIRPEFVLDPALALGAPARALVHEGYPLQPCYPRLGNYRTAPCPLDPEAAAAGRAPRCTRFSPERVAGEILALLEGRDE